MHCKLHYVHIYSPLSPVNMSGRSWSYWAPAAASGPSHDSHSIHHKSGNGSSARARERQGEKGCMRSKMKNLQIESQGKEGDKVKQKKRGKKEKRASRDKLNQTGKYMRITEFIGSMYSSPHSPLHHEIHNVYVYRDLQSYPVICLLAIWPTTFL